MEAYHYSAAHRDPTEGRHCSRAAAVAWGFGRAKSLAGNVTIKVLVTSIFMSLEPRTL